VKRLLPAWGAAAAWAAVIFYFSSRTSLPIPQVWGIDKVEHFTAYGILAVLCALACEASGIHPWWGLVIALLYGISDELHQAFVPGRSCDVFDWMADSAGAAAAIYLHHRRRLRAAPSARADGDRAGLRVPAR
jgi:VanZ family protein